MKPAAFQMLPPKHQVLFSLKSLPFMKELKEGTRIIYDRKFLMECRNSPVTRTPPRDLPTIPGVTSPTGEEPPMEASQNHLRSSPEDKPAGGSQAEVPAEAIFPLAPFSVTVTIKRLKSKAQGHRANREMLWSENQRFGKGGLRQQTSKCLFQLCPPHSDFTSLC
ncbi:hypothetical protein CB1_000667025 [Camelus ferus]|nr:hypothetical protein CB1_000667025 [Camelus ferus]